jgi:hypothetical protein
MSEVIKVVDNGRVAVLVSRGFGAGWSTWADRDLQEHLLFEHNVVNFLQENPEEVDKIKAYMTLTYPDAYLGGLDGLCVHWVPQGEKFRIHEYDGAESLVLMSEEKWVTA